MDGSPSFVEMLENILKLPLVVKRNDFEDFLEFVIRKENLDELTRVIEDYFGEPLKAAGKAPSPEQSRQAAKIGGIWDNQTLYFSDRDDGPAYAMFWPWGDGVLITVKLLNKDAALGNAPDGVQAS